MLLDYFIFLTFIVYSIWLFRLPLEDGLVRNGILRLDIIPRSKQSQVWLEALRQLYSHKSVRSELQYYITKRQAVLYKIKGYIEIGDLVRQKDLIPPLDHLVTKLQDYDQNMLRLENIHQSTLEKIKAFRRTLHAEFSILIHQASQAPTILNQSTRSTDHRHALTTQLRSTKLFVCVAARSIIHGLYIFVVDTMPELNLSPDPPREESRAIRNNPLFKVLNKEPEDSNNLLILPCKLLTNLGLDASHLLHETLVNDLARLARWQRTIETDYWTMRHELVEIDACLHDFLDLLNDLKVENLQAKNDGVMEIIKRMDELTASSNPPTQ